ncbi:MAG: hypothetical protein R2747_01145 [Pyrinomonadaceae bacterium]
MSKTRFIRTLICSFVALFFLSLNLTAQEPTPPPVENDEPVRIFTEEVHLNLTVRSSYGRSVPRLKADDLLVVESGDPQTITSIKRVPASVLVLLDTGGNLNFVKNINKTRLTAKILVENLSDENSLAVVQAHDRIETVSDWTRDRPSVRDDLDKKLFGGKRSRFSEAVREAIRMFADRPLENRHLVYIGDALDSVAAPEEREAALLDLLAANITVHIIAYNQMEAAQAGRASRRFQIGEEREAPRLPDHILETIIQTLPNGMKDDFRRLMRSERLLILRLDNRQIKAARKKRADWIAAATEMEALAEDTGGMFQAPEYVETMWAFAVEVARAIDSQYVITYTPTKPIAERGGFDIRKVRVSTHLDGVRLTSRHKIVIGPEKNQ